MGKRSCFVLPILAALLLAGLMLTVGCGKKGDPLPPLTQGNIISPPVNLAYTLEGSRVKLIWEHRVDPVNAKIAPEGFEVFVATKSIEGCQGCPFIFKPAGVVPMPETQFSYELGPDNYYFRVRAVGGRGLKSEFSSTLNIERD